MQPSSANVVVDISSTKQAALFFDHVIPIQGVEGYRALDEVESPHELAQGVIRKLLPPDFGTEIEIDKFVPAAATGIHMIQIAVGFYNCEPMDKKADELFGHLFTPLERWLEVKPPVTVCSLDGVGDDDNGDTMETEKQIQEAATVLSIANVQIPDVSNLDWDLILEFRKDEQARKRLRRLRVFAANEYAGKSHAFIEDDLCVRMEGYQNTLKAWNIKTVLGALSTALDEKTALGVAVANAVSVLNGLSTPVSLAASIAIPISHFAIELAKIQIERQSIIDEFPLAYLMNVKNLAGDGPIAAQR